MDATTFVVLTVAGMVAVYGTDHVLQRAKKAGATLLATSAQVFVVLLVVLAVTAIAFVAWDLIMNVPPPVADSSSDREETDRGGPLD